MKSMEILPEGQRLTADQLAFIESHCENDATKTLLMRYHKALVALEEEYKRQLTWSVADVQKVIDDENENADREGKGLQLIELSEEELEEVLNMALRKADAEQGVSWDSIKDALQDYLDNGKGDC